MVQRFPLHARQPGDVNHNSFLLLELKAAGKGVLVEFVKRGFREVFDNKKEEPVAQRLCDLIFFGRERQTPRSFLQPLNFDR